MTVIRGTRSRAEVVHLGATASRLAAVGVVVGLAALAGSLAWSWVSTGGTDRFFQAYLVNFAYFLSVALGALFFVVLQHLTRAGWSVVMRRLAEAIAQSLQLMALLFLPILLFAMPVLYPWARLETVLHDHLIQAKTPYLNVTFFTVRWLIYFAVWIALAGYFYNRSLRQDATGEKQITIKMQRVAAPGMALFAATLTFASFDMLMSLDPHWFSTIFGVYYFAGSTLAIFAVLALAVVLLQRSGRLDRSVTVEHFHDLGKFLFGFTIFWAYIAFSQYMLIWVADVPEETGWFLRRQTGGWITVSLLLLIGHFFVPFLVLITRDAKRRKAPLVTMAVWILAMHWVDIFWLAGPEFAAPGTVALGLSELGTFVGLGALFVAFTSFKLRRCTLVPVRDPRLDESLALDNA